MDLLKPLVLAQLKDVCQLTCYRIGSSEDRYLLAHTVDKLSTEEGMVLFNDGESTPDIRPDGITVIVKPKDSAYQAIITFSNYRDVSNLAKVFNDSNLSTYFHISWSVGNIDSSIEAINGLSNLLVIRRSMGFSTLADTRVDTIIGSIQSDKFSDSFRVSTDDINTIIALRDVLN